MPMVEESYAKGTILREQRIDGNEHLRYGIVASSVISRAAQVE